MRNVITLVLGGGQGRRLYPLTKFRAKPAVPLAAKYRLIDIPLSNCINSGLNRVYVLTQFLSVSLHRHIRQTYRFDMFSGGFVEVLAAQQTMDSGTDWYQGTADAVRKQLHYIRHQGVEYVLILSGDQLYRMDYRQMIEAHIASGAHVSVAGLPVHSREAGALGIMRLNESGRVEGFVEKPQTEAEVDPVRMDPAWMESQGIDAAGRDCIANMGVYLFNRDILEEVLTGSSHTDFGHEIFPQLVKDRYVRMHVFDGYWEDIGTIRAFYEANLDLAKAEPQFHLVTSSAPIYTRPRFLPPTRIGNDKIRDSLIADGCRLGERVVIENSVIGLRCMIGDDVVIRDSVVMGADEYQTDEELAADRAAGRPPIGIGRGSVIEGAIIDKNARIGCDVRVINEHGVEDGEERDDCMIRDGIPVVLKDATLPDNWSF